MSAGSLHLILIAVCWLSYSLVNGAPVASDWANKKADIYFLVDSSSSVWIRDYHTMLRMIHDLVGEMDVRPDATRVGLGVFSDFFHTFIELNGPRSKQELMNTILDTPYITGNTYLSRALKGLRESGLSIPLTRPDVPLIAVMFTDGASVHRQLTLDNATLVKEDAISLFTVGIGKEVDRNELRSIASDPKSTFSHWVANFNELENIRADLSAKMAKVELLQQDSAACGKNTKVDTVFVYDEAAIGDQNNEKVQQFLRDVTGDFNMNSGNVRVGVVSKLCHEGDIQLGEFLTKEDFSAGLENANNKQGMSILMKRARQASFMSENGARSDAVKRMVLIVHAPLSDFDDCKREAFWTARHGIEMFIIRVGTNYSKSNMIDLAFTEDRVSYIESFSDLVDKKHIFTRKFCKNLL